MLADFEEILHWPPAAWRRMGWGEFWARRRHLVGRMRHREQERQRLMRQAQRKG